MVCAPNPWGTDHAYAPWRARSDSRLRGNDGVRAGNDGVGPRNDGGALRVGGTQAAPSPRASRTHHVVSRPPPVIPA